MHPIQFPQFVLPTSIDTVVPSTSPQFFLPASMDAEISTYSIYREPAVDIMVSSEFPQYGPYASAQHTSNNNTGTGTPDTFPFHHSTNSFNPNAGAVGIMTTG
ncbi:hypothetical protein N7481_003468 [Penicillium waksmanii]|uniref:uncharacterized protein n=1 Tax=Penicillium waksmanii TaxID=69791 RepID=UPI002546EC0F|nr:uncharacterized protein N7481_003468 [Penicillium waksmanii]KAJ5988258.1 hypothetical protein N7481_003468 [Penicillium waksmanii]